MRDVLRAKIKRELFIIACVLALAGIFFALARFTQKHAERSGPMLAKWASFEQNLAVLGLDPAEIEVAVRLQAFMDEYPAYAGADYRQAASYYLSEYPQMGERDAFYALAASAQGRIDRAKGALARSSQMMGLATLLSWLAFCVPWCYPVYFLVRLSLAARRKK